MQLARQQNKEEWSIYSSCEEFRPDGWTQGQPVKYAIRAYAELRAPQLVGTKWISGGRLNYPRDGIAELSDSPVAVHDMMFEELSTRIEALRI